MSKKAQPPASPNEEVVESQSTWQLQEVIRAGVLKALGRPAELYKVAVLPLWGDNYRVNVVTGDLCTTVKIPNSYFVTVDPLGNILLSVPQIQKLY